MEQAEFVTSASTTLIPVISEATGSESFCVIESFTSRSRRDMEKFVVSLTLHNLKPKAEFTLLLQPFGVTMSECFSAVVILMGVVLNAGFY